MLLGGYGGDVVGWQQPPPAFPLSSMLLLLLTIPFFLAYSTVCIHDDTRKSCCAGVSPTRRRFCEAAPG